MNIRYIYIIALIIFTSQLLLSQNLKQTMQGKIFRQDTNFTDLIYIQKEFRLGNNNTGTLQHIFYDNKNQIKASESVELLEKKIVNYDFRIFDWGVYGNIKEVDNKILISKTIDGKTKRKELKLKGNLVVGPMLPQYINDNFDKIKNGESLFFYLPYFDRLTLIKMEIVKVKERINNEVHIEMKLHNPILRFLLPPVKMTLSNNGNIVNIDGPTILPDPAQPNSRNTVNTNIIYKYGEFK